MSQDIEAEHNAEPDKQEEPEDIGEIDLVPTFPTKLVASPRLRAAVWLAKAIMILFGVVVMVLIITIVPCIFWGKDYTPVFDMAKMILPYIATPLGVALGFFFAMRES